jgi:uncharacterized protein YoxC
MLIMESLGLGPLELLSAILIAVFLLFPVVIVFLLFRRTSIITQNAQESIALQKEIKGLLEKNIELLEENNRLLKRE